MRITKTEAGNERLIAGSNKYFRRKIDLIAVSCISFQSTLQVNIVTKISMFDESSFYSFSPRITFSLFLERQLRC